MVQVIICVIAFILLFIMLTFSIPFTRLRIYDRKSLKQVNFAIDNANLFKLMSVQEASDYFMDIHADVIEQFVAKADFYIYQNYVVACWKEGDGASLYVDKTCVFSGISKYDAKRLLNAIKK